MRRPAARASSIRHGSCPTRSAPAPDPGVVLHRILALPDARPVLPSAGVRLAAPKRRQAARQAVGGEARARRGQRHRRLIHCACGQGGNGARAWGWGLTRYVAAMSCGSVTPPHIPAAATRRARPQTTATQVPNPPESTHAALARAATHSTRACCPGRRRCSRCPCCCAARVPLHPSTRCQTRRPRSGTSPPPTTDLHGCHDAWLQVVACRYCHVRQNRLSAGGERACGLQCAAQTRTLPRSAALGCAARPRSVACGFALRCTPSRLPGS